MRIALVAALALALFLSPPSGKPEPFLAVLGIAQDGGVPQTGDTVSPAWDDPSKRRLVACLGLVDPAREKRWLIDATPDVKEQLHRLDRLAPGPGAVDGVFLTHAHIGHYLGLAQFGHEAMGAGGIAVYTMPRMAEFLRQNGPWDQLVRYRNIELRPLEAGRAIALGGGLSLTPVPVPHRQEYSEVVGYWIRGPSRSALYIPDIDSWRKWDEAGVRIEDWIGRVDAAYLDGTFFDDGEIPGRDMSGFPHPFIARSMERFASLPEAERAKIRFIHLNHTNPALDPGSPQRRRLEAAGFRIAQPLEHFGL